MQETLALCSPVISAREVAMLKMMELMNIPQNYFPTQKLRSILDKTMTVSTNPKVHHYPNWHLRSCANDAVNNCKFFTLITKKHFPLFFFYILHHQFHIRWVPNFLQSSNQLIQVWIYLCLVGATYLPWQKCGLDSSVDPRLTRDFVNPSHFHQTPDFSCLFPAITGSAHVW